MTTASTHPNITDDGRLLLRAYAENKDRTALSEFFAFHQDSLYSFALRVLRNPDDAQDAIQMAFVDVMRRANEHAGISYLERRRHIHREA